MSGGANEDSIRKGRCKMETSPDYNARAEAFLTRFGVKLTATWKDTACPPWEDGKDHIHGDHYRIYLSRRRNVQGGTRRNLAFDFWNSANDSRNGINPSAYDVLSCISSDVFCPDTFEEFCAEYGYEEDSRRAERTFRKLSAFSNRLQSFFTEEEIAALGDIR